MPIHFQQQSVKVVRCWDQNPPIQQFEIRQISMKQSNQPNFASYLSRQDGLTPKSQKKYSQPEQKPYEGLLGRRNTRANQDTTRNDSRDYMQERISASPLKLPLSRAIEKTVKNITGAQLDRSRRAQPSAQRRTLLKKYSANPDESSYYLKQDVQLDEIDQILKHMHHETVGFLNKYFEPAALGEIPLELFVDKVIDEYQNLWNNQQAGEILSVFIERMTSMLGGDILDLRVLQVVTKDDGIIGLILRIFKELKQEEGSRSVIYGQGNVYNAGYGHQSGYNPNSMTSLKKSFEERLDGANSSDIQNIKNIIQEFMETMYKCMENEIYSKFNVEMRRMVLKYKESEKILKLVNDKITNNIDVFHAEQKKLEKQRLLEAEIQDGKEKLQKNQILLEKEKLLNKNMKSENQKLSLEIKRLTDNLDKFQNHILKQTEYDPTLSRQVSLPVVDPVLSRHVSQPQIFTTALTNPLSTTPLNDKNAANKSTFADYYQTSIVNNTMGHGASPPRLDVSNLSGYKSTSILAPSLGGGNIKININHQTIQKDPNGSSFYSAAVSPVLERSISIGFQTNRENMRLDNLNMTPPKVTFTRVEHSPFNKSRVSKILQ